MAITYRLVKGSSLTHLEMDDNFRSVIYSSSIRDDGDTLRLHYDTVTQGANSYVDIAIGMNDSGSVSIIGNDLGNVITATGNTGSFQGETNFNFLNNKLTITGSGASISINDQEGNMFIGLLAGYSATGSSNNIGIGDNASRNIEGTYNTTLGINSLQNATTSDENVVIGNNALQTLSSGDNNTALGASTGINNSSGDKNVYIGYAAGPSSSVSENDKLYINTVASDTPLILGDFVTQQLEFAGGVTGSSFTGSFVGDGSEITGIDSEWDGSYIGDASITGSLTISGSGAILNTQEIQYDIVHAAAGHSTGRVFWDAAANTLAADMLGSDVTLQIGQEMHLYAKNTSGITLVNGTAVRITGASGVNIEIGPTLSVTESISNTTIDQDQIVGLVTEDIANNGFGYVTTAGAVRGIDTSTFAAGDILYVSHTATGSYSTSKPPSPFFTAKVGIVEVSNPSNGVILVSPSEPLHLTDLANITGSNVPAGISYLVHDDTTKIISFTSELSGSFSGSFAGDGSGLTGVVSSSVPYTTGSGTDSIQSAFNQADAGGVISVVAGGRNNTIASTGEASYIGAGRGNTITGSYSAILAGTGSNSKSQGSIILGGSENLIEAGGINSSILAGKGGTVNFNASSIVSGDNIQAARKYTAHATSVYVTGSTAELVGDFGGVLQLARRETTPTLSGDYEGMIINSGSATRSDLYFYSGTNDGWVKITV